MERFWNKVDIKNNDECWIWLGVSRDNVYGAFKYKGKTIDSHRMAWFLSYGYFSKKFICHHCDIPKCCNPKHLFEGTHKENMEDARKKKRIASGDKSWTRIHPERVKRGESHPNSKLIWSQVHKIRERLEKQESCISISKDYNVDESTIRNIGDFKTWKHK